MLKKCKHCGLESVTRKMLVNLSVNGDGIKFCYSAEVYGVVPGASIRCQNWGCSNVYACQIRLRLKPNPKPSSPFPSLPFPLSQFHSLPLRFPCHSGFPYSSVKFSDPHPPSLLPVWTVPSPPTCIGTEPWPPVDGTGSFTRITPPPEKNFEI